MAVEDIFSAFPATEAGAEVGPASAGGGDSGDLEAETPILPMNKLAYRDVSAKVSIGPPPDWVNLRPLDFDFEPDVMGSSTCLLWDRQDHAEKSQQYHREVYRLETLQAVQDFARQKINFDPGSQQLVVHSIAVIRKGQRTEQAELNRFHFSQRGDALENSVINGWTTLLLVLEDIRVGDVIDASYSVMGPSRILPERFCRFYLLPSGIPTRVLHVDVRLATGRAMRWKSSPEELQPELRQGDGESRLEWKRENLMEALPETNVPPWFAAGNWVQVTDCESWEEVGGACLKSWPFENSSPRIKELADSLTAGARTPEDRADLIINHVQDTFRYLEIGPEAGGQVPAPSDDVIRRGFGGCKDLALLMALLLRAVDIPARPVLVDGRFTGRVRDFLPMPIAFDHAVVEYELGGEWYWVDPASRLQGGGARNRPIKDYGFGLVLKPGVKDLQARPDPKAEAGEYKLNEIFWLNSADPWSILEVQITATGAQADVLRNWFASQPESAIAQEREAFYARMFAQVRRVGRIERKDYRNRNEFIFAEMFEVAGALRPLGNGAYGFFAYPSHLIQAVFPRPLKEDRQSPYALPFPCNFEHAISVDLPGLQTGIMPPYNLRHPAFHLNRRSKFSLGYHTVIYSFQTQADSVLPDDIREFKKAADETWYETIFNVEVPSGITGHRPRNRGPYLRE